MLLLLECEAIALSLQILNNITQQLDIKLVNAGPAAVAKLRRSQLSWLL